MARILLVEGEQAVAELLERALARAGYATTTVATRAQALALADDARFDIALVDVTLPDGDGHVVVEALHQLAHAPVVMLSESREQADREAWRDSAEDYVVKPIRHPEVLSLVRAALRRWRARGGFGEILRAGPLELDTLLSAVRLHGAELKLPPKEIALLTRLMRAAGRPVTREQLLLDVWGEHPNGTSRTLDAHVGTLRAHLGDETDEPHFIHTVRGVGFRFSSPAELCGRIRSGAPTGSATAGSDRRPRAR